MGNAAGRVTR